MDKITITTIISIKVKPLCDFENIFFSQIKFNDNPVGAALCGRPPREPAEGLPYGKFVTTEATSYVSFSGSVTRTIILLYPTSVPEGVRVLST